MENSKKRKNILTLCICLQFYFLCFFTSLVFAENQVNIIDFGAKGDDRVHDTLSIQNAINHQSKNGGGTVFFPKGEYFIDAIQSIVVKSNITLRFEVGVVLRALPNDKEHSQVIRIRDVSNVSVIGPVQIIGEREQHLGTSGEWGMGISIRGSNNIVIENVQISNCWGDGIYIAGNEKQNFSQNITIKKPVLTNNRRQGISVISVKNLEIIDARITKTNGTNPQSAITIEPNNVRDHLDGIRIINLSSEHNVRFGIQIYLKYFAGSKNLVNIYVNSTKNIKDPEGLAVREYKNVKGEIKVGEYYYMTGSNYKLRPIVNKVSNESKAVTGFIQARSSITVKSNNVVIGSAASEAGGKFKVTIPIQKGGTKLSITAIDVKGKVSEEIQTVVQGTRFKDLKYSHWANHEIFFLSNSKIVNGYPNNSFQPNKPIRRSEAAKMLVDALKLPIKPYRNQYSDVTKEFWASNAISTVSDARLFTGYLNGTFQPNKNLSRAEMAKLLTIAYNLSGESTKNFTDVSDSHWAEEFISKIFLNGITLGYPDNTFRPESPITRAEYSVFLARAIKPEFRVN